MPIKNSPRKRSKSAPYSLERSTQKHIASESIPTYLAAMLAGMPQPAIDTSVRRASLFRNGRNQAVRIPREFEFPPGEVNMYREGDRLIIEPLPQMSDLAALFASWEPLTDEFPDVDAGSLPLPDVAL